MVEEQTEVKTGDTKTEDEVKTKDVSTGDSKTEDIETEDEAPPKDVENEESEDMKTEDTKTEDEVKTKDVSTGDSKTEDTKSEDTNEDNKTEDEAPMDAENGESEDKTKDNKTEDEATKDVENGASKPSLLEMKIIRQVEYYFGNVNLWRDKFLKEKRKEDDGWVTIECLTTFNRLQALSTDFDEIVNALAKSLTGLLEIHEDKTKIRRSLEKPLPDQDDPILRKASKMKTLYMKGFPTTYKLDDVQDFILSQGYQNIFIKMRMDEERNFKGSIIVELATIEEAKKVLENDIKVGDEVLKVMTRDDYFRHKSEKGRSKKPSDGGNKQNDDDEVKVEQDPPKLGCVLHFKGADEKSSREDLKEVFGKHDEDIEWVDFSIGETQGYIRFKNEGGAKKVIEAVKAANDGKIIIKEKELEARVIEGIEEKNYWILAMEDKKRPKFQGNRGNQGNRGRRKRESRGQEGWRKRRRPWEHDRRTEKVDEKPKNTHTKFDDNNDSAIRKDSSETVGKKAKVETTVET